MLMPDNSEFIVVKDPNMAEVRTSPQVLDIECRIVGYDEIEKTYTEDQAKSESARCLKCPTHWCSRECPAGVPVTEFIAAARSGDYEGAYRLIRSASMLPEICSRVCTQEQQCQSNCTRSIRTQAVGIGKLERFVVEQHYAGGADEPHAAPTGKRVAVVGSGPAGLSAAQRLVDLGHSVVVYERDERPGGLLEYGIPNMNLEKGVVERKVDSLKAQGVVFHTGVDVGTDQNTDTLVNENDAVIIAVGARNARTLDLEGAENVKGIISATEFLSASTRAVLAGETPMFACGKQVVIVGGGDTGNDCVGTAIRQNCAGVTQLKRRPPKYGRQIIHEGRPSRPKERKTDFSQEECRHVFGDPHIYQTTVKAVQADENGFIKSATIVSLEPKYDSHFHLTMVEIPDSQRTIPCELLVIAAGFVEPENYVATSFGAVTDEKSNFSTEHYAASVSKVFACGDCRTGQSLVVKAMTDGRNCADAVDEFLK